MSEYFLKDYDVAIYDLSDQKYRIYHQFGDNAIKFKLSEINQWVVHSKCENYFKAFRCVKINYVYVFLWTLEKCYKECVSCRSIYIRQ